MLPCHQKMAKWRLTCTIAIVAFPAILHGQGVRMDESKPPHPHSIYLLLTFAALVATLF
jgi:hypothetical protein